MRGQEIFCEILPSPSHCLLCAIPAEAWNYETCFYTGLMCIVYECVLIVK